MESGLPFEQIAEAVLRKNPALHKRVKKLSKESGISVMDLMLKMTLQFTEKLERGPEEFERLSSKID